MPTIIRLQHFQLQAMNTSLEQTVEFTDSNGTAKLPSAMQIQDITLPSFMLVVMI